MEGINKWGLLSSLLGIINSNSEEDTTSIVLAKYFLQNFNRLPELNIYDMAEECFVTRSAIRRFCQSLGYDNYKALKTQFKNMQENYRYYKDVTVTEDYGEKIATELYEMALDCNQNLQGRAYDIADLLHESEQVVFLASDIYSKHCSEFQKGMILLGKMVRIVGQQFENNKLLSTLTEKDTLFNVSVGGFFAGVTEKIVQKLPCRKILLTSRHSKKYETMYDDVLYLCSHDLGADRTVYHVYAVPYCLDLILFSYKKKYVEGRGDF